MKTFHGLRKGVARLRRLSAAGQPVMVSAFHSHGGTPHSWMVYDGKSELKWMITGGIPI